MLRLTLCACDALAFQSLKDAVSTSELANELILTVNPCDGSCGGKGCLWLQAEGKASYHFKEVDPVRDRVDILATARCYLASPEGWIEDARPCGRLRFCLAARIPP